MFTIRVFALLPQELRHHLRWYRISVRMEGAGLFKNFVNFVRIGSWPFSKFWQNPSGLLPSLPYHWPGSSQCSETAHHSLALGTVRTCLKVACCHWSPTCCPKAEFRTNGHRSHPCPIDWNGTVPVSHNANSTCFPSTSMSATQWFKIVMFDICSWVLGVTLQSINIDIQLRTSKHTKFITQERKFSWTNWGQIWIQMVEISPKMAFSLYSHEVLHAPNFLSKFTRVGLSSPPPDSPSSTPNTHASMLFLLYELGNGLEWVKNTGTLIPKTSEAYFLLCWASGRHFLNFFVRQPLNRIF